MLAAETLFARDDLAADVEIILVAQQALNACAQKLLLFCQFNIHPLPSFVAVSSLCLRAIFSENRLPLFRIML
jgi:hypothetical protein